MIDNSTLWLFRSMLGLLHSHICWRKRIIEWCVVREYMYSAVFNKQAFWYVPSMPVVLFTAVHWSFCTRGQREKVCFCPSFFQTWHQGINPRDTASFTQLECSVLSLVCLQGHDCSGFHFRCHTVYATATTKLSSQNICKHSSYLWMLWKQTDSTEPKNLSHSPFT